MLRIKDLPSFLKGWKEVCVGEYRDKFEPQSEDSFSIDTVCANEDFLNIILVFYILVSAFIL